MLKIDGNKIGKIVIDGSVIRKIITDGFIVYNAESSINDLHFIVDNGIAIMFAKSDTDSINLYDGNSLKTTYNLSE